MESNTSPTQESMPLPENGLIFDLNSLYSYLCRLKDKRARRGKRYRLTTLLVLMVLAKLCGENKISGMADWAQYRRSELVEMLDLKYDKMPHHSTYRRILSEVIDAQEFNQRVGEFFNQGVEAEQEIILVIDGKTLRGTISREDPFGVHLLAAYLPEQGLVLMQMVVEKEKENEIVVAPKLLSSLDLRHKIVVADAMHTQRQLSTQIVQAGGEYVWIVKDNQPTTRQAIEQLFAPEKPIPGLGCPPLDFHIEETLDKEHGRLEKRQITVSSLLNDYLDWPEVQQVFKLERRFTYLATGVVTHEVQYGLTSLTPSEASPQRLLEIVRSEWAIENGLHYRRDVTFEEDSTLMTSKNMAQAMAALNNLVTGLLALQGFHNFAKARRYYDAHPKQALSLIY